jgi:hypothetical protein
MNAMLDPSIVAANPHGSAWNRVRACFIAIFE